MQMTNKLGLFQELYPGSPGLGHIPRAMTAEDSTDGGIVARIQEAVKQRMISPEAAQYLIENLLASDSDTVQAVRRMPVPKASPMMENTFPYSLNNGLLGE